MDLACELGMSLQRVRSETTSREFNKWRRYFRRKLNRHEKQDYYLASIVAELRRANSKKGVRVRLQDFLLKFTFGKKPKTSTSIEDRTARSKAYWMALAGYGKPRKQVPPPRRPSNDKPRTDRSPTRR